MTSLSSMAPDFRALCAELLADYELNRFRVELAAEARAALAVEAVGVSDEDVQEAVNALDDAYRAHHGWVSNGCTEAHRAGLRAVLALCSAPRPVPVAERLPEEADCDADGQGTITQEPDFRALCAKLIDRWTKGKDYWTVLAQIQSALAYDPRNSESYDTYSYGTEPIPFDTTWAQAEQTKAPDS